jgi:hypothetical protein
MTTIEPPLLPDPIELPTRRERVANWLRKHGPLNKLAAKALEAADIILGSIPGADVVAEIKDVALKAIEK